MMYSVTIEALVSENTFLFEESVRGLLINKNTND